MTQGLRAKRTWHARSLGGEVVQLRPDDFFVVGVSPLDFQVDSGWLRQVTCIGIELLNPKNPAEPGANESRKMHFDEGPHNRRASRLG